MRISRRNFIKSLTASTAGVAAAGLLASCNSAASSAPAASSASASEAPAESTAADASSVQPAQLLETDVAVIGLGASGMLAALGAADKGANVIAIDTAPNFEATTNTHTTGSWLVESSEQLKYDHYLTQEQAFGRIMEGTNYQCNGKVVRNMLKVSGRAADIMIQGGVQFMYAFANSDENTDWLSRGGHVYLEEGEPRANNFREMCAARSTLTTMFSTRATQLLTDSDGKVTGLLAEGSDGVIQINAKAVICCGGGFLANADMVKEHFAGAQIVNQGFATVDGSTIQMCQSVGAQLGKNFSVSCNEMGAANFKAKPQYSWAPGRNTSACFYLPQFGNILMDKNGNRFPIPEYPPANSYGTMQERLITSYLEMAYDNDAWCAPVGMAWRRVRAERPDYVLYAQDCFHPGPLGSYLAANVIFTTIYGKPYQTACTLDFPAEQAEYIQRVAQQTVLENLTLLNIKR